LDKLAKRESEVETMERLFTKIKNKFGETIEEERKRLEWGYSKKASRGRKPTNHYWRVARENGKIR